MKTSRRNALCGVVAVLALAAAGPTSAHAAPIWNLDIHHHQTHFTPGGTAQYWFDIANVGDENTSGQVKVTITLPSGITRDSVLATGAGAPKVLWSCPGSPGQTTVICTTSDSIPRHTVARGALELNVAVNFAPGFEGERFAAAKVEGGGATNLASAVEQTQISGEEAGFGVVAKSFAPDFYEADEATQVRVAGAHPDLFTIPFDLNSIAIPSFQFPFLKGEAESVHDLTVDLPPGFIGAPTAVGECAAAQFTSGQCPPSSQVGRIDLTVAPILQNTSFNVSVPVYNFFHPRGSISDLGFSVAGNPIHIRVGLNPANRYGISSEVLAINETLPPFSQKLTLWGVPADPSHDSERCGLLEVGDTSQDCSTDAALKPFLALPSQCEDDNVFRLHHYDSWQHTGVFGPDINYTMPGKITDCDKPRFEPDVEIEPTGKQANTPTGLDVHITVKQNENPNALATPPVKSTVVTLPKGTSFSPSFADGLKSCTLAQMKLGTNEQVQCPDASRIGEVEIHTPLLPKSAVGSMYLAAQKDNPYGSTFAMLLVAEDTEERGALIKIPGRIDVDPATGQITTSFDDLPQFPFDDFTLKFRSGPRAPLVSPPSCGKQTIGVKVASYAQPQKPVDASNTYEVTEGPNGTPCPPDEARRPFHPEFSGGTLNPVAGAYSPFLFRLSRSDDEQELTGVKTVLPPGLVGKLAGKTLCPDQAIASISTAEFAGAGERDNPACPASSEFGSISAGLGAGPGPNYFGGKVYLAGPYKGAPLSLAVVAPALAGPFDLGNVVVRAALQIDPTTAQVTAVSDPFPTILHGVILRTRDVRLRIDRPDTTLNPTNCSRMSVDGEILRSGRSALQRPEPLPGRLLRFFGVQAQARPEALRRHQARSPPQAEGRSALPRRGCQHGKRLGSPAPQRVPRPGPHQDDLHQGAVRSRRLPPRLDLRHGQGQEPAAGRSPQRPDLPQKLQQPPARPGGHLQGREDRRRPLRSDRLQERRHQKHLRRRPRRAGLLGGLHLPGRQEGPAAELAQHLQGSHAQGQGGLQRAERRSLGVQAAAQGEVREGQEALQAGASAAPAAGAAVAS